MTILGDGDAKGIQAAADELDRGRAIVIAGTPPQGYAIVATDPVVINRAKRRPADQPVGVGISDLDLVADHLALDRDDLALARWLSAEQEISLHVPVRETQPGWMAPATVNGLFFFAAAWRANLRPLIAERGHLYMSSANITQDQTARTASEADTGFGGELLVLDDGVTGPQTDRGSTTIVQLTAGGQMKLARSGVSDRGMDEQAFISRLRRCWTATAARRRP